MTPEEILDLPMVANSAGVGTVRGYLKALLTEMWEQGEGFSGKRPFGESGWYLDLYQPLIAAGVVPGTLDAEGYIEELPDRHAAERAIAAAIQAL